MKKLFCLILALVCIGSAALAATVPSKTTADLNTTTKVTTESGAPLDSLVVVPVAETEESKAAYEQKLEICNTELQKLAEVVATTNSVVEYFGEVKTTAGEAVSLEGKSVDEFMPLVVAGVETVGTEETVKVGFKFATTYAKDQVVVVLIGVANPLIDEVEWTALEGVGTEDGGIEVVFPVEMLETIQNGDAMMAVASDVE